MTKLDVRQLVHPYWGHNVIITMACSKSKNTPYVLFALLSTFATSSSFALCPSDGRAFSMSAPSTTIRHSNELSASRNEPRNEDTAVDISRRHLFRSTPAVAAAASLMVATAVAPIAVADDEAQPDASSSGAKTVFKTPSGLKYIDLIPGTGPTPQYGQLVTFQYTSYIKLPDTTSKPNQKPQQFDSSTFVTKHGNGRLIPGLDEGLHTLKVGGTRRLLIPPKLGYVDIGLGPIPSMPWDRWKLNGLLDDMIAAQGGTVVVQVKLLSVFDDEADQGYYNDASLTPEEFETLKGNLQRKAAAANAASPASAALETATSS